MAIQVIVKHNRRVHLKHIDSEFSSQCGGGWGWVWMASEDNVRK